MYLVAIEKSLSVMEIKREVGRAVEWAPPHFWFASDRFGGMVFFFRP
jgi:hypothetical protein